ncbi:MAG TPA: hypothetical protein VNR60_12790 [Croceibacterium sp.]|nr:hypothetical protein [Croceibacterium sp.]
MHKGSETSRRSLLKASAILAAPVIAAVPSVAGAADGSRARLARLEDEHAIEALQRKFLRYLNGSDEGSDLLASSEAMDVGKGLRAVSQLGQEPELGLEDEGQSAIMRCSYRVEREIELTGNSTIEQMSRLQGQGSYREREERLLTTRFVKSEQGWRIAAATLA